MSAILCSFTNIGNTGMAIGDSGVGIFNTLERREEDKRNSARNAPELVWIFSLEVGNRVGK